ncbi:uncharacterized protein [Henckelia pumila]|uniref:uncharacterized protein n=1 Tax=Henckelia pumila TaxID=405737 RepID=UPI003C6E7C4C
MSKAYDRVEWKFLEAIMLKMGFAPNWVGLIMRCVTSVSYSFRINQSVYGNLQPQRGLRQGGPLSPYLFALCAQGFSTILNNVAERRFFRGVKIARNSPMVSHLFFANDSLIFYRANPHECAKVKRCIDRYAEASGQVVNFDKFAITFCPSSSLAVIGLPTFSIKSKQIQFASLRDRVFKRINGWTSKLFSAGGKEILIKSVLQAIPSYAMSCFKISFSLYKDIERLCAKFWWKSSKDSNGMHWASWDKLCLPKQSGGLGFRSMIEFNKALLAKQVWRIIQYPDSLMARLLKSKYFKHGDILDAPRGSNSSFIWKSIIWSRELISKGLIWSVGDGRNIHALSDAWIPGIASGKSSVVGNDFQGCKVADFINRDGHWVEAKFRTVFPSFEVEEILNIPLFSGGRVDRSLSDEDAIEDQESAEFWGLVFFENLVKLYITRTLSMFMPYNSGRDNPRYWKWTKNDCYSVKTEFNGARLLSLRPNLSVSSNSNSRWVKPPSGHFRLDVDAGFDDIKGRFSVGIIIRDCNGEIIAAQVSPIRNPDSLEAISAVHDNSVWLGPVGHLIAYIHDLLSEDIFLGLNHMSRSANIIAHNLAPFASSRSRPATWTFSGFPVWLSNIVFKDIGV